MTDYSNLTGYQDLFNNSVAQLAGIHSVGASTANDLNSKLGGIIDQFKSQFTNMVGRAPTDDELNHFSSTQLTDVFNQGGGILKNDPTSQRNALVQNIGDNYQQAAKDYATSQLTSQQGQATDLANLFRSQGNDAINQTQSQLLDYQSKLFDKLRPNLITSLKAQGLLDTGGLNEAMAGQQADLANQAGGYLADARLQNENAANQIAFSGASAPYQYQQSNILNQVPQMVSNGQNAMGMNYNTFLTNLNYQNQLGLQAQAGRIQSDAQPSFLRTMGQGFANGLGTSMGQGIGSWMNPSAYASQGQGGSSGAAGLKMLMA